MELKVVDVSAHIKGKIPAAKLCKQQGELARTDKQNFELVEWFSQFLKPFKILSDMLEGVARYNPQSTSAQKDISTSSRCIKQHINNCWA